MPIVLLEYSDLKITGCIMLRIIPIFGFLLTSCGFGDLEEVELASTSGGNLAILEAEVTHDGGTCIKASEKSCREIKVNDALACRLNQGDKIRLVDAKGRHGFTLNDRKRFPFLYFFHLEYVLTDSPASAAEKGMDSEGSQPTGKSELSLDQAIAEITSNNPENRASQDGQSINGASQNYAWLNPCTDELIQRIMRNGRQKANTENRKARPLRVLLEHISIKAGTKIPVEEPPHLLHTMPNKGAFTSLFGWRNCRECSKFHAAVDIAAPIETPIVATEMGTFLAQVPMGTAGNVCTFAFPDGAKNRSFHTRSGAHLNPGSPVNQDQPVCRIGLTGTTSGPHNHYEYGPEGEFRPKERFGVDPLKHTPQGWNKIERWSIARFLYRILKSVRDTPAWAYIRNFFKEYGLISNNLSLSEIASNPEYNMVDTVLHGDHNIDSAPQGGPFDQEGYIATEPSLSDSVNL